MVSLDRYCAECVIGGLGSFIISVHQAEDFASRSERPHAGMERPASRCHWPINWLEEERLRRAFSIRHLRHQRASELFVRP
ncbi:DUF1194 domain-containing protein [Sinorhizobium meliloti]|nr:DUF1194 domain-containing protein [Sinorhizobium meliloti]